MIGVLVRQLQVSSAFSEVYVCLLECYMELHLLEYPAGLIRAVAFSLPPLHPAVRPAAAIVVSLGRHGPVASPPGA